MLETIWFCLVALMVTTYVVLDGYDLGASIVHVFVARSDDERRLISKSIGPFWEGNEVWLLAGGHALFRVSGLVRGGFYLPLMMVRWLLMLRRISSFEFRGHVESDVWRPLWDVTFGLSNALLALFFVVRGACGWMCPAFFLPLWIDFGISGPLGILDWYTVTVGVATVLTLTLHVALWVAWRQRVASRKDAAGSRRAPGG
jgi:cytochrome d ubiquinol oxidase subunit II